MRKAVLIYNPFAGGGRGERQNAIEAVASVLRAGGIDAALAPTRAAGSAPEQVREALREGCDMVVACGGDGTVHEVLQGLAETSSNASLGLIPLGTGNVLAKDLGLPANPIAAARSLLQFRPKRIAAGKLCYCNAAGEAVARYFTVAAGVGAHAQLIYAANANVKQQRGLVAYYTKGFHVLFTHPFAPFEAEVTRVDGETMRGTVQEIVAMRVRSFGGMLKRWMPGGALEHDYLQLVVIRDASRRGLVPYTAATILGSKWRPAGVEIMPAARVLCKPAACPIGETARIHVQADGEIIGQMPLEISIVPNAFTLLMPRA
ncbi:MAG TPA: diacylglycerol kinase family protein [Clostridia bacterium]|nr:diacylglycerol kinase family protein [Clostridia bacterium]